MEMKDVEMYPKHEARGMRRHRMLALALCAVALAIAITAVMAWNTARSTQQRLEACEAAGTWR
jgi:uncharacterized iron-regulated membrane protein